MTDGCWGCRFQTLGGHLTFLGWCVWFEARGQERKQIPPSVVDVGCRFWASHEKK